jgi:hypothetical protein
MIAIIDQAPPPPLFFPHPKDKNPLASPQPPPPGKGYNCEVVVHGLAVYDSAFDDDAFGLRGFIFVFV